jgi:CheY-like chemotaxis protein
MTMTSKKFKVFVLEDEAPKIEKIRHDLKDADYELKFFSKGESMIDLLKFNPDILIADYFNKKIFNHYEWSVRY